MDPAGPVGPTLAWYTVKKQNMAIPLGRMTSHRERRTWVVQCLAPGSEFCQAFTLCDGCRNKKTLWRTFSRKKPPAISQETHKGGRWKAVSVNMWKTTHVLSWKNASLSPVLGAAVTLLLIFGLKLSGPASVLTKSALRYPLRPSEGKSSIIFLTQWLLSSQTQLAPGMEPWDCLPTWTFSRETTRPDSHCCHEQGVSTGSADSLFSSAPNGKIVWKKAWNVYQRATAFSVNDEMTAN